MMLYDMNLPDKHMDDADKIHQKIRQIEDEFDFILIADRWANF